MHCAQHYGFHQCESRISSTPAPMILVPASEKYGNDLGTVSWMLLSLFPVDCRALFILTNPVSPITV